MDDRLDNGRPRETKKERFGYLILFSAIISGHLVFGESQDSASAKIGLLISLLAGIVAISFIVVMYAIKGISPKKDDLIELILGVGIIAFMAYIPAYFISHFYMINSKIAAISVPSITIATFLVSALVLLVGSAFFLLRLKMRFTYGLLEVVVGVYFAAQKIQSEGQLLLSQAVSQPLALAILTGAVYLVVRGLDNMHQGIKLDPLGRRFSKWIDSVTDSKPAPPY